MWTISAIRSFYSSGQGSPLSLVKSLLDRIHNDHAKNAWIYIASLEELAPYFHALEKSSPHDLPLWGIPFAVKDNIDVAGMPSSAACPDYRYIPSLSSPVVDILIRLGAIPLGKTNMDQFATGLVGTRSPFGIVENPRFPGYIAGGSSSGSAAAMALGHVAFALGTDTAGSGRVPAAFCELIGVKPSPGVLDTSGVIPACKSLDSISLFTHNLEEAELLLRLAKTDGTLLEIAANTIYIPHPESLQFFGDSQYHEKWNQWVNELKSISGLQIKPLDITPFLEVAKLLYQGPWIAERWSAVGDFIQENPEAIHPVTKQVLELGKFVTGAEVFQGFEKLKKFQEMAFSQFPKDGILLLPTTGGIFRIEDVLENPLKRNQELGTYTNFLNLLGMCGVAIPAGRTPMGLPFGITCVGHKGMDLSLIHMAKRLSQKHTTLAVVGAHLRGLPLNHELLECGATFLYATTTSKQYRLFALQGKIPKPGLIRDPKGAPISVELWNIPLESFGQFVSRIPWPLGIGQVELLDGKWVQGFLCDPGTALQETEITEYGGWRNYLSSCDSLP